MTAFAPDLLKEIARYPATSVCEAAVEALVMDARVGPLWSGAAVCGPAFTVALAPGDNLALHHAIVRAPAGSILVATGGVEGRAVWGELMTVAARARGLSGLIVDGWVRDRAAIRQAAWPVFARGTTLRRAGRSGGGTLGRPVECGGITVTTGDLVVADEDGIVVVPVSEGRDSRGRGLASQGLASQGLASQGLDLAGLLERLRERAEAERRVIAQLHDGRTTIEIFGLPGVGEPSTG